MRCLAAVLTKHLGELENNDLVEKDASGYYRILNPMLEMVIKMANAKP